MSSPLPTGRWRLLCGTLAVGLTIAAGVGTGFGLEIASRSWLLWGTVAATAIAAVGMLVLACLPESFVTTLIRKGAALRNDLSAADPATATRITFLLPLAAVLAFGAGAWRQRIENDDPTDDDQQAFLETAIEIRDTGGVTGLVRDLLSGEFAEANRHPLYLAVLSLRPEVPFGRSIALLFAALTLGLSWLCARRLWGDSVAGGLAVLLGTNGAFVRFSGLVVCETLLMLCCAAAWFAALHLFRHNRSQEPVAVQWPLVAVIGGLLGLAWLTKATALLLLPITAVWLFFEVRRRQQSWGRAVFSGVLLMAAFVVVASPLLIRNGVRFGNPVFNVNSSLLFADHYADPEAVWGGESTRTLALRYWETHSLGEIVQREVSGCVWEAYIFVRMLGPAPLDDGRVLAGLVLLVVALLGWMADPTLGWRLAALWTLLLWGVFAWYVPIAAGERFLLPPLIPWLTAASTGLVRAGIARWGAERASFWFTATGLAWCAVWGTLQWLLPPGAGT